MNRKVCLAIALCLAASGCSTFSGGKTAAPAEAGPPLVDGFYVEKGDRCSEACPTFGTWTSTGPSDVYETASDSAAIIATLVNGDRVKTSPGETRVRPLRGVVTKGAAGLNPGDVIYQLFDDGEGFSYQVWHNGRMLDIEADGTNAPDVAWDPIPEGSQMSVWWVQVELADGRKGWLRNPFNFDGMSPLS